MSSSATYGTPRSARAAASIDDRRRRRRHARRPRCATCIVSRVDPPVVTTSSMTTTRSVSVSMNPRRSVSTPSCRSANSARTPRARPTSWPMTTPPSAGDSTTVGFKSRTALGDGTTQRFGVRRILQHQRALEIAAAVQSGGQAEVAVEQGAGAAEQVEQFVASHGARSRSRKPEPLTTEP